MDVSTRQQMWKNIFGDVIDKEAELAGTYDMPNSKPQKSDPKDKKAVITKVASAEETEDELLKEAFDAVGVHPFDAGPTVPPDDNEDKPVKGKQPASEPQQSALKPKVDVSGKEPPKFVQTKEAQYYAVPSQRRYPLDGYDQVKMASAYFDEWWKSMEPAMRWEYAQNLTKRASALSIPVSELAEHYGGSRANPTQIKIALDARRTSLTDEGRQEMLDKIASVQHRLDDMTLVAVLTEFDKMAGLEEHWGGDVPDPYFSVFTKTANVDKAKVPGDETLVEGNESIPARKMVEFVQRHHELLKEKFGDEISSEFVKDPLGIYKSLPRDQKLILLHMANSTDEVSTS